MSGDERMILTIPQVCVCLSISEATLFRLARTKNDFPAKVQLSPNRVGYRKSDVLDYVARRTSKAAA